MCMDGNNYDDWKIVAEQYADQMDLYVQHLLVWTERVKQADLSEAAQAFARAVTALGVAQTEFSAAAKCLQSEHAPRFALEVFNVESTPGLSGPQPERSALHSDLHSHHGHSHAHQHPHPG